MTAAELAQRIGAVKDGDEWRTRCPIHNDYRPSLNFRDGDRGAIVYACRSKGCPSAAIAAHFNRMNGGDAWRTEWIIRDAAGRHVATHCREDRDDGKHVWWTRPDGSKKLGMKISSLPLYGAERVAAAPADALVAVCEGEKAADAARAYGYLAVGSVTGASHCPGPQALEVLRGHPVVLWPDHDDVGASHMARIADALAGVVAELHIVRWPAGTPPKHDAADVSADLARELVDAAEPWQQNDVLVPVVGAATVASRSLSDVEQLAAAWLHDPDPVPLRAVLAAYVANRKLEGDPTWLLLVGGSGIGKTERLNALCSMPDVVMASSISGPAALLSGTGRKERAGDATGGLLRRIPPGGGVLVLKDFSSIIDMHRDARAEVLAALREVFDGRWDRNIGAEGGRTLTWVGHLGVVAGCTTAIDSAHAVVSAMGTRFVQVRLLDSGSEDLAASALAQAGRETELRDALRDAARGLLDNLPGSPLPFDAQVIDGLKALGSLVARARSPVDRDSSSEIRLVLDPEAPTRVVKMLGQLWRAAGMLGLDRAGAWALVRRVGLDSIPKLRRRVLDHLTTVEKASTTEVAAAVEHPSQTTRRALEDLVAHAVVLRQAGGQGKADLWRLSPQSAGWVARLAFPVSSDPVHTPGGSVGVLMNPNTPNDDITGKVASCEVRLRRYLRRSRP